MNWSTSVSWSGNSSASNHMGITIKGGTWLHSLSSASPNPCEHLRRIHKLMGGFVLKLNTENSGCSKCLYIEYKQHSKLTNVEIFLFCHNFCIP